MCPGGDETARVHRERCRFFFKKIEWLRSCDDAEAMGGDVRICILLRHRSTLLRCWVVVVGCQRTHIYRDWLSQPSVIK